MKHFALTALVMLVLTFICGCAGIAQNLAAPQQQAVVEQTAVDGYCHKKLEPIGPTDVLRRTMGSGDFIDYYGPCDGPSVSEQIQAQKRFERFRFGRDYADEG